MTHIFNNSVNPYRMAMGRCIARVEAGITSPGDAAIEVIYFLQVLETEVQAGLVTSLSEAAQAEALDDLLDQATEYFNRSHLAGAAVLATAVFEDTMRRLADKHQALPAGEKMDAVVTALEKKGAISSVMAKRCRAAAGTRNEALHANWEKVTLADVEPVIRLTRQLLEHLGSDAG